MLSYVLLHMDIRSMYLDFCILRPEEALQVFKRATLALQARVHVEFCDDDVYVFDSL